MLEDDNDDLEVSIWEEYKSRNELKQHRGTNTYRKFAIKPNGSSSQHTNMKKHRKYKCFDVYLAHSGIDANIKQELLNRIDLFEVEKPGNLNKYMTTNIMHIEGERSYYFSEYSLNKKKRWLLPEILTSISDEEFKVDKVESVQNIYKNKDLFGLRLESPSDVKEDVVQDCDCQFEIRYKRGNRMIVKKHKKECNNLKKKESAVKSSDLFLDFNFGFHERFYKHQDFRILTCFIKYKNYKFRNRKAVAERLRSEVNDTVLKVKENEKIIGNDEYIEKSFIFYVLRRKIMKKLRDDGTYNISLIQGQKSFGAKATVEDRILVELEACKSTAKQIKARKKSLTCEICCSDVSCLLSISPCQHNACYECWITYVNTMIDKFKTASNVKPISCLYQNCETQISLEFLMKIISTSRINKYKVAYVETQLLRSDKYAYCRNVECDKVLIRNPKNENAIACACNEVTCGLCNQESHLPLPCKYYSLLQVEPSEKKVLTVGKFCTKCSRYIEKNGGCSHMTCICGHSFCWNCMNSTANHNKCVPVEAMTFNADLFEGDNDVQNYLHLAEIRKSIKRIIGLKKQNENSEIAQSLLTDHMYKNFRKDLLRNEYTSMLFKSNENVDLIMQNALEEMFLVMKHFSQYNLCCAFLTLLLSRKKILKSYQLTMKEMTLAMKYITEMYSLYKSKSNLQQVLKLVKTVEQMRNFMIHLTNKYKNSISELSNYDI